MNGSRASGRTWRAPDWRALCLAASLAAAAGVTGPLLVAPALAQSGDVTVRDVRLGSGPLAYRAASVTLKGSALSASDAAALLSAAGPDLPQALARLTADEITIPELVGETKAADGVQTTTYRDVLLRDVRQGRVGNLTASGGTMRSTRPDHGGSGAFGALRIEALDLPLALSLYGGGVDQEALRPLYSALTVEAVEVAGADDQTIRIGRIAGRDLQVRPGRSGWVAAVAALSDMPSADKASPQERQRTVALLANLFESFAFATLTAGEVSIRSAGQEVGRIAEIAVTGSAAGGRPGILVAGLDLASDDNHVRIDRITLAGSRSGAGLAALAAMVGKSPEELGPADLRALVPPEGSVRLDGIAVDSPVPGKKTVRSSLASFEAALDTPVGDVPSRLRLVFDGLDMPIAGTADPGLAQVAALGYDRLAGRFATEIAWDQASGDLILRDMSVAAPGMGRVSVGAVLGGLSKDILNPDTTLATIALVGAAARSLDVTVENAGLAERIVDAKARETGRTPDAVRRDLGLAAAIGIPVLLGGSPPARALGQAAARFMAKPGRLVVHARSKDPAGLGLAEFAAGAEPRDILERLDVTAQAE